MWIIRRGIGSWQADWNHAGKSFWGWLSDGEKSQEKYFNSGNGNHNMFPIFCIVKRGNESKREEYVQPQDRRYDPLPAGCG